MGASHHRRHILDWQVADKEEQAAWELLVQRCFFHTLRNGSRKVCGLGVSMIGILRREDQQALKQRTMRGSVKQKTKKKRVPLAGQDRVMRQCQELACTATPTTSSNTERSAVNNETRKEAR